MMRKHALVEVLRDGRAMFSKHGHRGFNAGKLFGGLGGNLYFSLKMHTQYIFKP
jgi:hypothetical protein